MLNLIDNFLNRFTMYFLVLWFLRILIGVGVVLSFFGLLPFSPLALILSILFFVCGGWMVNKVFAFVFEVPANVESYAISSYILALIIRPPASYHDLGFMFWAIVLTLASKFIVAWHHKHIFNPVAFGVAMTALFLDQSANWWVGSRVMLPIVAIGGVLIIRKLRRFTMVGSFLAAAMFSISLIATINGTSLLTILPKAIFDSPLIFFAIIMLTEPITTPPTESLRVMYAGLIGLLFAPQLNIFGIFSTPELALLVGNIFSFAVSPKWRVDLKLKEKIQLSPDEWDFVFTPDKKINFTAGQYLEWTIPPAKMDNRGNRRYFTLASSPTESDIRLGLKYYDKPSTFKQALLKLNPGDQIVASQLSGEFILHKDPNRKYVFLAGGIGVTPYRSIVKFLSDSNQKRDAVLIYADKTDQEFVYKDVFSEGASKFGLKTVYVPTNTAGYIDANLIQREVPDFKDRHFYISGSHAVVEALKKTVKSLGVPTSQIKTDFFPGFV